MKELRPGWAWTTFGEIVKSLRNGISVKPDSEQGLAILKISAVRPMNLRMDERRYLGHAAGYETYQLSAGDLLFTRYNGNRTLVGVCAMVPELYETLVYPDKLIRAQLKPGLLPSFFEAAVNHGFSREWLQSRVRTTAGQCGISGTDLKSMPVPVPPALEQVRITAEISKQLTRLDAGLHALERAKANLSRCRSAATESAFAEYSSAPIRLLGDLGEIVGGVTKGQKRKAGVQTRPVPYLRVANVQRGHLNLDQIKHIEVTEAEIRSLRLIPGDLLLNEGGDRDKLGRGWIWEGQIEECTHQNHVFRVRLNPLLATPRFVSHYANYFGQRYFFEEGKQTTNLASINMTKLRAMPIPLPPVQRQQRVVTELEDHLSMIDDLDRSVDANLKRAARLRQAILKKAFEGKLVSQDPNDEPASVLLERIRSIRVHSPATRSRKLRS